MILRRCVFSKILLLGFSFLFTCLTSNAQQNKIIISSGDYSENDNRRTRLLFAKEDVDGSIFVVRKDGPVLSSGYFIEHYSKDLKFLKSTYIDSWKSEIRGLYITQSEIVLLQFTYQQKEKKYALLKLSSGKENFDFAEKVLFSVNRDEIKKYDDFGAFESPAMNPFNTHKMPVNIVESSSGKYVAFNFLTKKGSYIITVLNRNMDPVGVINFERKTSKAIIEYQNMVIDDKNGDIYLLEKLCKVDTNKIIKNGKPNCLFNLLKLNFDDQRSILLGSEFYFDSLILATNESQLTAFGFYFGEPSGFFGSTGLEGIGRFSIDKENFTLTTIKKSPFSHHFMLEKFGDKKNPSVSKHLIRNYSFTKEGDLYFNAEDAVFVNNGLNSSEVFSDIIFFKSNDEAITQWDRVIKKRQVPIFTKTIQFSYASTYLNGNTYIFINEPFDKTNSWEVKDRIIGSTYNNSSLKCISVDQVGEYIYNKSLQNLSERAILEIRYGIPINNNVIVVEGVYKRKKKLYKITIS
jgi:hypothetical protein